MHKKWMAVISVFLFGFIIALYGTQSVIATGPHIQIGKFTNGDPANLPPGPMLNVGDPVEWRYYVINLGTVDLTNVTVVDDQGVEVTCPRDYLLAESGSLREMNCYGYGVAEAGQYVNVATACGEANGQTVCASAPSHYFGKEPQTGGGQGCTPGYWKQDQHFDSWVNYSPTDDFEATFGVNASFNLTLLGALELGGGGEEALARHAVAALLNASNSEVDYFYTATQVIALVQDAYATNNFEQVKDDLEVQNEAGCPLD